MEERGITAGEIVCLLKRRIFWILLAAGIAALAAALFTAFVYNRARQEYALTFVVENAAEPFRYDTVVYADNLEEAKASDGAFARIDTERMAANEEISILRAGGEDGYPTYTLTVAGRYFSDRAQATAFLRAVVERAVAQAETIDRSSLFPRLLPSLFAPFAGVRMCAAEASQQGGARVRYRQNVVSVIDNGASPLLAAVAGFVLVVALAALIFCAADYPAYERKKLAEGARTKAPETDSPDRN